MGMAPSHKFDPSGCQYHIFTLCDNTIIGIPQAGMAGWHVGAWCHLELNSHTIDTSTRNSI